ncbi:BREX-1 system adenine-specific DNA-methyltransferase PglX [Ectopseudomonas toyotomiensis]|uniref:BREX-1 system adenine-specific DNA-methyltransferase PglX n=1 Tax=Ectopseudomonas toyotomiensis TaxID=554344 RepID=UPI003D12C469
MSNSQENTFTKDTEDYFFRSSAEDFNKFPDSPIVYWVGRNFLEAYSKMSRLSARAVKGLDTNGSIELFLKRWFEISSKSFKPLSQGSDHWYPIAKGGEFRKWYGNNEFCINYQHGGGALKKNKANLRNADRYFKEGITWTVVSSGGFAVRYMPDGFLFDQGGSGIFLESNDRYSLHDILGSLNSKFVGRVAKLLCPTINFTTGDVRKFPIEKNSRIADVATDCIRLSKADWDSYETSWDFASLPLLQSDYRQPTLKGSYQTLRAHWREMTLEMQRLEEEINHIFIDAYGLQDELTPDVPLNEITLTCNPHYRYGGDKSEEELEALLLADTMRELVSYGVGCMFGRYSLDKPGLILANQGETLVDYLAQVPEPSFLADDDNVIPLLDGDWFPDDITLRFRQFLRVAFGDANYEDNLAFIEQALNIKGKRNYSLRDYFLDEFYSDHISTASAKRAGYKKRPIYWLFSSPKGTFNALVYLHRYRPDTVSVVLKYLRDFRDKLAARLGYLQKVAISPDASQSEKTKASKEADTVKKQLLELENYERETLYPLAQQAVSGKLCLDLDDGVKVNYLKLGSALKKIVGLDAKGED